MRSIFRSILVAAWCVVVCLFGEAFGAAKTCLGRVGRADGRVAAECSQGGDGKIRGVNLGGWLVLEPWITPSLFARYPESVVDEWTLTEYLGKEAGRRVMEAHWSSWVGEEEIRELASYGVTHVRIPVGYWAVDIAEGEPYVEGALGHLLEGIVWAGRHGVKVIVDLHAVPGSQNGNDHSGRRGERGWLGHEDRVRRTVGVIERLAKVLSGERYAPHVFGIGLVNEPTEEGMDRLVEYYKEAMGRVRAHLPHARVVVDAAFKPLDAWNGVLDGDESVFLDTHPYQVFDAVSLNRTVAEHVAGACAVGREIGKVAVHRPVLVGEWSGAMTDCAPWLNGRGRGARWDGTLEGYDGPAHGACGPFRNALVGTPEGRAAVWAYASGQMGAYEQGSGWLFWNFKTEADSPDWNYLRGVREGYIPRADAAREAAC